MALEDFDASEIVTLNFESIRPSLKGTMKLLRVPEPSDYTNYFIVDRLAVAAETFVQQFSLSELGVLPTDFPYSLLELLMFVDCSQGLSSFELFPSVQ